LAFVVSVARAQVGSALTVTLSALAYVAVMFLVVRPLATKWVDWTESRNLDKQATPVLLVAVLCSSLITEAIGIHAVFGAFLFGAIIPHDSRIAKDLSHKLHDIVTIVLLPAFFAITGMNTQIRLIDGVGGWLLCLVIILIAFLGKCGGTIAAARFVGFNWRTSNALGILMNTRGLMELIVLNIGLSLGVISSQLFAMMVLMAIVTTIITAPILRKLMPQPQ
jgi:Kef-type K+ transport system membrane component KefB